MRARPDSAPNRRLQILGWVLLGHASSQTTQRYAHLADSRAMREASMAAVTMLANTDR